VLVVLGAALISLAARVAEFMVISVTLKLIAMIHGFVIRCISDVAIIVGLAFTVAVVKGVVISGAVNPFPPVWTLVGTALVPTLIIVIVRPIPVTASVWKLRIVGPFNVVARCANPVRGKALVWLAVSWAFVHVPRWAVKLGINCIPWIAGFCQAPVCCRVVGLTIPPVSIIIGRIARLIVLPVCCWAIRRVHARVHVCCRAVGCIIWPVGRRVVRVGVLPVCGAVPLTIDRAERLIVNKAVRLLVRGAVLVMHVTLCGCLDTALAAGFLGACVAAAGCLGLQGCLAGVLVPLLAALTPLVTA
jgi:hypothetical protein